MKNTKLTIALQYLNLIFKSFALPTKTLTVEQIPSCLDRPPPRGGWRAFALPFIHPWLTSDDKYLAMFPRSIRPDSSTYFRVNDRINNAGNGRRSACREWVMMEALFALVGCWLFPSSLYHGGVLVFMWQITLRLVWLGRRRLQPMRPPAYSADNVGLTSLLITFLRVL